MVAGGKQTRVLSLDGGGVRGLSSLVILESLLDLVKQQLALSDSVGSDEELLPSELFDHIVGTSTGGLIAVMLVKLNMRTSECISAYKELLPRIFGRRRFGSCIGGLGVPQYSEETFRKCIQGTLDKYGKRVSGEALRFMEEANVGNNKSYCTVVCRELYPSGRRMNQPAFICSHYCRSTQQESGKYIPYELWQTCRATTAAPTFFSRIIIHGRIFIDGAFGNTNNPTRKAHFHFLEKVSGYKEHDVIWMNIGTGSPQPHRDALSNRSIHASAATSPTTYKRSWKDRLIPKLILEAKNLLRDLEAIATDSDRVEEEMEDIINTKSNSQHISFARVSANNGVAEIQLDDWRSLGKIEQLTRTYLQRPQVQAKLRRMAEQLAEETLRRRRLQPKKDVGTVDRPQSLIVPPFLRTGDDISPLPSPIITLSRPNRASQHTASLQGLSPLEPSPVSPLTNTTTRTGPGDTNVEQDGTGTQPGVKVPSPRAMISPSRSHRQSQSESSILNDPNISPILRARDRAQSKWTQDLLASVCGLPGMSVPNDANEARFSNMEWTGYGRAGRRGSEVVDEKWKRRTTVF